MTTVDHSPVSPPELAALRDTIYRDGIAGLPGAFGRAWGQQLAEDVALLFDEARGHDGGTVSRGPNRYYFAVHPERLRGFVDLATHPLVTGLSEHMLGGDYQIVEVAFDVPLPGAVHQPWHRDFPVPPETKDGGRLSSLAFNLTTVDVTPAMGPFEIAPGTQFDDFDDFRHGMFPPRTRWPRYEALRQRKYPRLGDMSVRTGLAIHRGTVNVSDRMRPVMVLGVVAPEVDTSDAHMLSLTRDYHRQLPAAVRRHLRCSVVEQLAPISQKHSIEGLVMGV